MSEGFEASHVPQQSRRDKLRILSHQHQQQHQHQQPNLLPYDPYLLQVPPDLLTCPSPVTSSLVKEENSSILLRFASNRSCTLPDPRSSSSENPSHFQDANPSLLCTQPHLGRAREWGDSSFGGNNGQGLSLSLSSRVHCHGNADDVQKNNPFELNLERYGSLAVYGGDKGGGSGSGPLGPFTGYSLILRGSRFLKPAQKLLEELTDVGRGMFFAERVAEADSSLMEGGVGGESIGNPDDPHRAGSGDSGELGGKKSRLISLLEEVCRRYMQYYQQLQDVVASFECVAELGNAAPYVNLALKAMSKHFRCLKDAIMDQLHFTSKTRVEKLADTRDDIASFGTIERSRLGQRATKNSGYLQQQPVWRPQRGLPERAVTVLRAWLFEHFLHPYPTDTDKLMLATQTGLSRCQVSNWFINARVRLWKPMVEEIHTLETQQMQVSQITRRDERSVTQTSNDHPQMSSSVLSASDARVGALTSALSTVRNEAARYLSHAAVGESIGSGTSNGVTLTLGLQHHRLGIAVETSGEGNVMGGYGTQDWQFGRDVCRGTWPASQ